MDPVPAVPFFLVTSGKSMVTSRVPLIFAGNRMTVALSVSMIPLTRAANVLNSNRSTAIAQNRRIVMTSRDVPAAAICSKIQR